MIVVWRNRFVLLAGLAYLVLELFSGPLRWMLTLVGLSVLIYAPKAMLGLATLWMLLDDPLRRGFTALNLIALVILGGASLIGFMFLSPKQVAMGFWVLLPFWYGLTCADVFFAYLSTVNRVVPALWLASAVGVIANNFVTWPWEGFAYSVGGVDVEGAREWWASGGIKRLSGFARSSFDAAVQAQLLGIVTALAFRSFVLRVAIWGITGVAVYLTTSKGVLLVFAVLTPIVILKRLLPESVLRPLPALIGLVGLGLPLLALIYTFTPDRSGDAAVVNALYSFYDRLNRMWPEAWALLGEHGNLLIGRGIGGIGTAQAYFESARFNAADNLFMYWFVVFGWMALPGFVLLLARSLRLRPFRSDVQLTVYCLLLATLVYGLTTNIVENAAFAIVSGLAIRWLAGSPTTVSVRPIPEATLRAYA